jgi:heme A synthase
VVQIGLGALTVLSRKDAALTTAHVVAGALVLGSSLILALLSRRTVRLRAVTRASDDASHHRSGPRVISR